MKLKFAKRLEKLLSDSQISNKEFSKKLGLSHQQIINYTGGNSLPSIQRLLEIAEFFNVSTDYLLGLSNIKNYESDLIQQLKNNEEIYKLVENILSNKNYDLFKNLVEDEVNIDILKILIHLNPKTKEKIKEMLEALTE